MFVLFASYYQLVQSLKLLLEYVIKMKKTTT